MGKEVPTRTTYEAARHTFGATSDTHVTHAAEQKAKTTGKLAPEVDPALGHPDAIRHSKLRLDKHGDRLIVTVGCPMDIESICDTTGSMGDNVDTALRVFPDTYDLVSKVLPGYDPQLALGIFADIQDKWPLQRPQFEMTADKIVEYLTNMSPERAGKDTPEDPQYGLFGAAFLTATYTNRIGLKGYHFTISDAPGRDGSNSNALAFSISNLQRVFGDSVFDLVRQNGHEIDEHNLPSTHSTVRHLLKRAHAFFLQVGDSSETSRFWTEVYDTERVIKLPDTKYLPHVKATIIGLTEGTLQIGGVRDFLRSTNLSGNIAEIIEAAVRNVPLLEQAKLREKLEHPVPVAGDIFANKSDLWPTSPSDDATKPPETAPKNWL
ncbi:hypothetical protein FWD07_01120 [Candidatus Saccharibacteria bacterium]|nr:hypothetical protein [Candidatus Saccharibacteria bacterium]